MMRFSAADLLRRKSARLILAAVIIASLVGYTYPLALTVPYVKDYWTYRYTESIFIDGDLTCIFNANWSYYVVRSLGDVFIIKVNGTSRHRFSLRNGSWISLSWNDTSWFTVNAKTRMYRSGYYTSWWIPQNINLGDTIPVWNINARVVGLAWVMVNGRLLECWILRYERPMEEYTFLYERTTGFFVKMIFKRVIGKSRIVAERIFVKASFNWPTLALMRPILVLTAIATFLLLLFSYLESLKRLLRRRKEAAIII